MSDAITSTTTTAAIVPEIWSQRFYDVLDARLPFIDSVSRDYEGEIQSLGDIVNISTIGDFAEGEELGEGARADAEEATVTGQQLVINKRIIRDYIVTNRAQLQSLPFMDKLRERAVFAINKKIQSLIIDTTVPSASTPDHTISFDSGTTLSLADMLEGKELLDDVDVPSENRKQITGSANWNDMFNITGFVSKDFVPAGSPLASGMFQTQLAGFDVDWTSVLSTTVHQFHPSYLTVAIQDQLAITVYDLGVQGTRAHRVNVDLLMGLKQLDNTRTVTIS